jgi:NADH-quinone oxidoreductase subunit C
VKVETDRDKPTIATVEGVWKAATWLEREIYDLFGVNFEGHSDLRRILLPDDWVGYPLRKDYQEAGGYHGIGNVAAGSAGAAFEGDGREAQGDCGGCGGAAVAAAAAAAAPPGHGSTAPATDPGEGRS